MENLILIGYRVGYEEDFCRQCAKERTGEFWPLLADSDGYAYLLDDDGLYEFQECLSCLGCDEILAAGTNELD